jgi:hypothetical protein
MRGLQLFALLVIFSGSAAHAASCDCTRFDARAAALETRVLELEQTLARVKNALASAAGGTSEAAFSPAGLVEGGAAGGELPAPTREGLPAPPRTRVRQGHGAQV